MVAWFSVVTQVEVEAQGNIASLMVEAHAAGYVVGRPIEPWHAAFEMQASMEVWFLGDYRFHLTSTGSVHPEPTQGSSAYSRQVRS